MTAKNMLTDAPPCEVEQAIRRLGRNLWTVRLRCNLTIKEIAEKIGTGPRAVMDAERGKHSTSLAVYAALLWAHDLLEPFQGLADPLTDEKGFALDRIGHRKRARSGKGLDSGF